MNLNVQTVILNTEKSNQNKWPGLRMSLETNDQVLE